MATNEKFLKSEFHTDRKPKVEATWTEQIPIAGHYLTRAQFNRSQIADQPRLPWAWTINGKRSAPYAPTVAGKWWSKTQTELGVMTENKRRNFGHIGRIMETGLGGQLEEDARCTACQANEHECWVYTEAGAKQISRPGDTCARCRVAARPGGCNLSKRRGSRRDLRPPTPGPRSLVPYKYFGNPPPGAGGGIAVLRCE